MGSKPPSQLEPWTDLQGKVVLVTGASSGFGREFCIDLAKYGCRIVAAARRVDRLNSLCQGINQPAGYSSSSSSPVNDVRAIAVELDVTDDEVGIDAAVRKAWDAFGRIDALVNNAGIRGTVTTPLNLSEGEWDQVFRTNLRGLWLVAKCVCIRMRDAKQGGSVINISSIAGINRGYLPGAVAYTCSKAAVNTLTKIMAMELGVYNIRVNSISPGLFKSEITQKLVEEEWLAGVARKIVPLRTYGSLDPALTSLLRYLVHDSSAYISGNVFIVDSGATLPGIPLFSSL